MSERSTILVVDDDPIVQEVVERIVTKAGYRALLASTGREALELLASNPSIRVATIDQGLPDTSGTALIRALHAREPRLRTIMISGDTRLAKAYEPADRFLPKPFREAQLLGTIAELEGGSQSAHTFTAKGAA